jgi:iron-sulfur cluster repair protein YtfE (RIC family)
MDIDRFKNQHVEILEGIAELRRLARSGIQTHAPAIAAKVAALSSVITLHLAIEDRILYPAVQNTGDAHLASMGKAYQEDMKGIASQYIAFSRRWSQPGEVAKQPESFRDDANTVLKMVHQRMQRENVEFYPAIEAA